MSNPEERRRWLRLSQPSGPINRRHFLAMTSGCLLATRSTVLSADTKLRQVDAGTLKDLTEDGISEKFTKDNFFLIRHEGKVFATIATCPHKGNFLLRDSKNPDRIICSGHDSEFNAKGVPLAGRVKKGLTRFGITVNDQGRILVTPDRKFAQKDWANKEAFLPAPKP